MGFKLDAYMPAARQASSVPDMFTSRDGLLGMRTDTNITKWINISDIGFNPLNRMSMNEEELAALEESIHLTGVDPLTVREGIKAKGEPPYVLLSGHRRLTAIKILQSKGLWDKSQVECKIIPLDKIELPISNENKELLLLRSRNQNRTKTDGDKLIELIDYKKVIAALREAGVEIIQFTDTPVQIKGEATLNILHIVTGMSRGTLEILNKIALDGIDDVQMAVIDGKIDMWQAGKIAKLSADEQAAKLEFILHPAVIEKQTDVPFWSEEDSEKMASSLMSVTNSWNAVRANMAGLDAKSRMELMKIADQITRINKSLDKIKKKQEKSNLK